MQRRNFLKNTGAMAAGSFILNGIPAKAFSNTNTNFTCQEVSDRIYVMVNLFGANDTLNTVVPISQYSIYANNRPNIRIMDTGANSYINLDTTLPLARQTALHPVMTAFKTLYDAGKLNIVHGIGYADNNRSHFKSDDLWNTNGDVTAANYNYDSGWAGQLFDYRYPGLIGNPSSQMPDPPCIELGSTNSSVLFQTATSSNASVLLTNNNVSTYYNTLVAVGGPSTNAFATTDYGVDMKYIADVQVVSNAYAARIQSIFNAGTNSTITYPNTSLGKQLKTVARLIKGGSKSSMFTVHQYGYDTHGSQVTAGSSHLGAHTILLKDLTDSIKAFQDDIALLGFEDRVITTTHSEFGRTIDENTGQGTDHGGVSTMFVIGKGVQGGITGNPIDLTQVNNRGLTDLQYDYRRVFAAVMQDFMGHGNQAMSAGRMTNFLTNKAPIVATNYKADPSCYVNQIVLPVTLLQLKAQLLPTGIATIKWQTANESNCKEFEVQHSTDGITWKTIGYKNGSNNTTTTTDYMLEHNKPTVGKNYYRLWQYDLYSSKRMYGPVNLLVKENANFVMKAYPNPAVFDFNIAITAEKQQVGLLQFYDVQGHKIQQQQVQINKGFNKYNYLTQHFKGYKGQLIIHLITNNEIERTLKLLLE